MPYMEALMPWCVFDEIRGRFLPAAHTHSDIDQLFSTTSRRLGTHDATTLSYMHLSFWSATMSLIKSHVWINASIGLGCVICPNVCLTSDLSHHTDSFSFVVHWQTMALCSNWDTRSTTIGWILQLVRKGITHTCFRSSLTWRTLQLSLLSVHRTRMKSRHI